jgi:hypothetical protein
MGHKEGSWVLEWWEKYAVSCYKEVKGTDLELAGRK